MLIKCEGGIDAALEYAKMWCKYVKELLSWIEKRLSYGESVHRTSWESVRFSIAFFFFLNRSQEHTVASKSIPVRNWPNTNPFSCFCLKIKTQSQNFFFPE